MHNSASFSSRRISTTTSVVSGGAGGAGGSGGGRGGTNGGSGVVTSGGSVSSTTTVGSTRNVLIHVFDEYRKSTKDFVCRRDVLLANMKYFQAYLNQSNEHDEIDISVHCDVDVFEWLVAYMRRRQQPLKPVKHILQRQQHRDPQSQPTQLSRQSEVSLLAAVDGNGDGLTGVDSGAANGSSEASTTLSYPSAAATATATLASPPRLSLDNVASILVSSEFLQMEPLVDECVRFIATRMQAFLQLRVDLSCLSDATVAKIADCCSAEQLHVLHDPKDKLLSKLHKKKLGAYVRRLCDANRATTTTTNNSTSHVVDRCVNCDAIFLRAAESVLACPRGRRAIGVHGELVSRHEARSDWRLDAFVRELTGCGNDKTAVGDVGGAGAAVVTAVPFSLSTVSTSVPVSSNAAYWYLWATTNCFFCSTCKRWFTVLDLHACAFHSGVVSGVGCDARFSCCGVRVFDWDDLGGGLGADSGRDLRLGESVRNQGVGAESRTTGLGTAAGTGTRGCCVKKHVPVFANDRCLLSGPSNRLDNQHPVENLSLRFCADDTLDVAHGGNSSTDGGSTHGRADANEGAGTVPLETRVETICKLPGLWDVICSCERVVRHVMTSRNPRAAARNDNATPTATTTTAFSSSSAANRSSSNSNSNSSTAASETTRASTGTAFATVAAPVSATPPVTTATASGGPTVPTHSVTAQQMTTLHALVHDEHASVAHTWQPPQLRAALPASTKRPSTATGAAGGGGSGTTPGGSSTAAVAITTKTEDTTSSSLRQRQFRALQRQERDRVRHQLLARRLVQMRKSATA